MLEPQISMVGNLVADPRMSTTPNGHNVATFRIAATPRRLDRGTGEWKDGETFFASVTCWRGLAENVMASLKKGHSVLVLGRASQREYVTQAGETRQPVEIDAIAIGPELARAFAIVKRSERSLSAGPSRPAVADHEHPMRTGDAAAADAGPEEPIDWDFGATDADELALQDVDEVATPELEVEVAAADVAEPAPELVGAGSGGLMGALGRAKGRSNGG
jgi:single-strand DNA-binding protein